MKPLSILSGLIALCALSCTTPSGRITHSEIIQDYSAHGVQIELDYLKQSGRDYFAKITVRNTGTESSHLTFATAFLLASGEKSPTAIVRASKARGLEAIRQLRNRYPTVYLYNDSWFNGIQTGLAGLIGRSPHYVELAPGAEASRVLVYRVAQPIEPAGIYFESILPGSYNRTTSKMDEGPSLHLKF